MDGDDGFNNGTIFVKLPMKFLGSTIISVRGLVSLSEEHNIQELVCSMHVV